MQDAAYPALASNLGMFFGGKRDTLPPELEALDNASATISVVPVERMI